MTQGQLYKLMAKKAFEQGLFSEGDIQKFMRPKNTQANYRKHYRVMKVLKGK